MLWIDACARTDLYGKKSNDLRNTHICSLHFETRMYGKSFLKKSAVPTKYLPVKGTLSVQTQTEPDINTTNETLEGSTENRRIRKQKYPTKYHGTIGHLSLISKVIETKISVDNSSQTNAALTDPLSRKRRPGNALLNANKKLKNDKSKDITAKQFSKGCDKFLSTQLAAIVKAQISFKRRSKYDRYTREFKRFCLNLFYTSPHSYRFLSKTICLPSKISMANMHIPFSTEINGQMWEVLTKSIKGMSAVDKNCILCMDVMRLKRSLFYNSKQGKIVGLHEINNEQRPYAAEFAFTIMLRGIISNWKQPVGFGFISSSKTEVKLNSWIVNTVKKLISLTFNVRAFVSNLGTVFLQLSNSLGISKETCSFVINDKKIYYIFNVPSLVKSVRNNLLDNDYEFENKIVKWDDIKKLYDLDNTRDVRCAPRLTDAHLTPNSFQKSKLRFAIQVFSNTVKAALESYVATGSLKVSNGTIEFVAFINDLFDLLNSSNNYSPNPFNTAYKVDDSQLDLLNRACNIFNNLSIKDKSTGQDVTNNMKFVNAFLVTINSITRLQSDLKCEGIESIITRRLNNDSIERFFDLIKRVGGNYQTPTCIQFTRAFRKIFLWEHMKLCNERKCTEDLDNVLIKYHSFFNSKPVLVSSSRGVSNVIAKREHHYYGFTEEDAFLYTCAYVLRKCIQKHKCIAMIKYACSYEGQSRSNATEILQETCSKKNNPFDGQGVPPDDFIKYCKQLNETLKASFKTFIGNNIENKLYHQLKEIKFEAKPCPCFPTKFAIKQFLRTRIYFIIKFNNRNFLITGTRYRAYFSV